MFGFILFLKGYCKQVKYVNSKTPLQNDMQVKPREKAINH